MSKTTRRTLTIALVLMLAGPSSALARAIGGKEYRGGIPETGYKFEGHHFSRTHAYGGLISLHVARNARTVSVHFTSSWPVLYCFTPKQVRVQTARPARISGSGSFTAHVEERFNPGPGLPPIVQVVSGHFNGRTLTGTIETRAGECSGRTSYYATAQ